MFPFFLFEQFVQTFRVKLSRRTSLLGKPHLMNGFLISHFIVEQFLYLFHAVFNHYLQLFLLQLKNLHLSAAGFPLWLWCLRNCPRSGMFWGRSTAARCSVVGGYLANLFVFVAKVLQFFNLLVLQLSKPALNVELRLLEGTPSDLFSELYGDIALGTALSIFLEYLASGILVKIGSPTWNFYWLVDLDVTLRLFHMIQSIKTIYQ